MATLAQDSCTSLFTESSMFALIYFAMTGPRSMNTFPSSRLGENGLSADGIVRPKVGRFRKALQRHWRHRDQIGELYLLRFVIEREAIISRFQLTYRFTVQNVLLCGYSIDAQCFDHNKTSEFVTAGRKMFEGTFWAGLKFMAFPILPNWLLDLIPIPWARLATVIHKVRLLIIDFNFLINRFLPDEMNKLFTQLVMENKASRGENDENSDVLQMLIQMQKKHGELITHKHLSIDLIDNSVDTDLTDLFLTGHTVTFFIDGTETSGLALMFTLYELARNPECQERLHKEIVDKVANCGGQLSFDEFQEIEYLEWTLMEAMRIHPPLMVMTKICTRKYTLPKVSSDAQPFTIHPGTPIMIPVSALHMCVLFQFAWISRTN